MDFTFFMPVQVFSGEGCLAQHADVLTAAARAAWRSTPMC